MCKEKLIERYRLKLSQTVSLELELNVSKEEYEEELNRQESKLLINKIYESYSPDIMFNIWIKGNNGLVKGNSGYDDEYQYNMNCFTLRIPAKSLDSEQHLDMLCNYLRRLKEENKNIDYYFWNDDLVITDADSNDIQVKDFIDILKIIELTKKDVEKILKDVGVSKAICCLEIEESNLMWELK